MDQRDGPSEDVREERSEVRSYPKKGCSIAEVFASQHVGKKGGGKVIVIFGKSNAIYLTVGPLTRGGPSERENYRRDITHPKK